MINPNGQPRRLNQKDYGIVPKLLGHALSLLAFCSSATFCSVLEDQQVKNFILDGSLEDALNTSSPKQQKEYRARIAMGDFVVKPEHGNHAVFNHGGFTERILKKS